MTLAKVLHRCWFGGTMPDEFVEYGQTWRDHHPGWHIFEWNDRNLPTLKNQKIFTNAEVLAPQNVGQLKADVARYELLLRFGGVYVDTDFECQRNIEPLIEGLDAFAAWEDNDKWIGNAILGATPGHPFFARLVDGLAANVRNNLGKRPNVMTGPQYLTRLWWADPMDVAVFSSEHFYPYRFDELHRANEKFEDAYAIHKWANQRRRRERKRAVDAPPR